MVQVSGGRTITDAMRDDSCSEQYIQGTLALGEFFHAWIGVRFFCQNENANENLPSISN